MYHTYTTQGIVLHSESTGDANRRLVLFTRTFGVIYVDVRSVRGHLSKLRPLTQIFSRGLFTLVRGRYGWKLINTIGGDNYYYELRNNEELLPILARAQSLIRRFVATEEAQEEIFDMYVTALDSMTSHSTRDAKLVESLMACRILRFLGFLTDEGFPQDVMSPYTDFSSEIIARVLPHRRQFNSRINTALRESGLS